MCLNAAYKIMTGVVAKYMREHAMENEIWDEGQLGAVEGVLGTVDNLVIDALWKKWNSTTEILLLHSTTTRRRMIKPIMTGCWQCTDG